MTDQYDVKARNMTSHPMYADLRPRIANALREAAKAEREACAAVCDDMIASMRPASSGLLRMAATNIRSRGAPE